MWRTKTHIPKIYRRCMCLYLCVSGLDRQLAAIAWEKTKQNKKNFKMQYIWWCEYQSRVKDSKPQKIWKNVFMQFLQVLYKNTEALGFWYFYWKKSKDTKKDDLLPQLIFFYSVKHKVIGLGSNIIITLTNITLQLYSCHSYAILHFFPLLGRCVCVCVCIKYTVGKYIEGLW